MCVSYTLKHFIFVVMVMGCVCIFSERVMASPSSAQPMSHEKGMPLQADMPYKERFSYLFANQEEHEIYAMRDVLHDHFPGLQESTLLDQEIKYLYFFLQRFSELSVEELRSRLVLWKKSHVFDRVDSNQNMLGEAHFELLDGEETFLLTFAKHVGSKDIDREFFHVVGNHLQDEEYKQILYVFFYRVLGLRKDLPSVLQTEVAMIFAMDELSYASITTYLLQDLLYYLTYLVMYVYDGFVFPDTAVLDDLFVGLDVLYTHLPIKLMRRIQRMNYHTSDYQVSEKQAVEIYNRIGDFLEYRRQHSYTEALPFGRLFVGTALEGDIDAENGSLFFELFLVRVLGLQKIPHIKIANSYKHASYQEILQYLQKMENAFSVKQTPYP